MKPAFSEKEFMGQVIELATMAGWLAYHTFDSRKSSAGFPDLVLVRRGRLIFAELKLDGKPLSREQSYWLEELRGVPGVNAFIWRPADWPAIEKELLRM